MRTTEKPSEHTRLTTIWMPEINALFVSDLAYNHVHSWGGIGVNREALENWLGILDGLIQQYGKPGIRVLPGHGPETDANLLYAQRGYLRELIAIVDSNKNDDAARAAMIERFPG